jgi:hypothetical protein
LKEISNQQINTQREDSEEEEVIVGAWELGMMQNTYLLLMILCIELVSKWSIEFV